MPPLIEGFSWDWFNWGYRTRQKNIIRFMIKTKHVEIDREREKKRTWWFVYIRSFLYTKVISLFIWIRSMARRLNQLRKSSLSTRRFKLTFFFLVICCWFICLIRWSNFMFIKYSFIIIIASYARQESRQRRSNYNRDSTSTISSTVWLRSPRSSMLNFSS